MASSGNTNCHFLIMLTVHTSTMLLLIVGGIHGNRPTWLVTPYDVCAQVNESVTLKCIIKDGNPVWAQKSPVDRDVSFGPYTRKCNTCHIHHDHSTGQFDLTINPIAKEDFGVWRCTQFQADPYYYETRIDLPTPCTGALINVTEGSIQGPQRVYETQEGTRISLSCVPEGCRSPCVKITWYKDDLEILHLENSTEIELNASRYDHGKQVTCKAWNSVSPTYQETSITLDIRFAPYNTAIHQEELADGTRLTCSSVSNPEASYYWPSLGKHGAMIEVPRSKEINVTCVASNRYGNDTSESWHLTQYGILTGQFHPAISAANSSVGLLFIAWLRILSALYFVRLLTS